MNLIQTVKEELLLEYGDEILEGHPIFAKWFDNLIAGDKVSLATVFKSMRNEFPNLQPGFKTHLQYRWRSLIRNHLYIQEDPSLRTYDQLTDDPIMYGWYGNKEYAIFSQIGEEWYPKTLPKI